MRYFFSMLVLVFDVCVRDIPHTKGSRDVLKGEYFDLLVVEEQGKIAYLFIYPIVCGKKSRHGREKYDDNGKNFEN